MDTEHEDNLELSFNSFVVTENIMVEMRDGTRLATDIYSPDTDDQHSLRTFPCLLQRTPYGKSSGERADEAEFFAKHGYVVVIQDCRGRYDSEGGFTKYTDEGEDGYDVLAWIERQSWSNGRVGSYGLSYAAHTQAAMASLEPSNLRCMWLDCGGFSDAFISGCRNNGAFELRQLTWAFREAFESRDVQNNPQKKLEMSKVDPKEMFLNLPWESSNSPLRWAPDYEKYLLHIWEEEQFTDYWEQIGLSISSNLNHFSDIPQIHLGGWYDTYAKSTTDNYLQLSKTKNGPIHLIMGPWTHGGRSVSYAGDVDLGPSAPVTGNLSPDYNHLRLTFFDKWLKTNNDSIDQNEKILIFVMGGGSGNKTAEGRIDHGGYWRSEEEWPLIDTNYTNLYLHPDNRLTQDPPDSEASTSTFRFDPENPVPTIGGNISSGQPVMVPGGFNQHESMEFFGSKIPYAPLSDRSDVQSFETSPLQYNLEITGTVLVKLWISSSALDTDFTAKLLDIYPANRDYPNGYSLNLTDGIFRCKFHESWKERTLLSPDGVYPITIALPPTSNLFTKDHRIRIDISSSNFPRFDVNPNTGENPVKSRHKVIAVNTIHHSVLYPSHLIVPIIDRNI